MAHEKERKRILVLRYRFIGDTILTVPFLRNLRRAEPDAYIAWVVAPGSSEVINGIPYVDELIYWDPVTIHADSRGTHKTVGDKLGFIRDLRARRFDKVYVLKRSFGSALMGFLSGARQRIGFATEGRSFLLTRAVPYRHDQHEVQNFLDVLRTDGVPVVNDYLEAWLSPDERQFADSFFQEAGVASGEMVISIHPFAANPPRAWHIDNFIELAGQLQERYNARILLLGGPRDHGALPGIRAALPKPPLEAVGTTSLRQTMALLARCQLMVCNDSGIMHLAASLRVPLVAIFGPQSPLKFGPWGGACRVVSRQFPCSPCKQKFFTECEPSQRGRPACLEAITANDVLVAITTELEATIREHASQLHSKSVSCKREGREASKVSIIIPSLNQSRFLERTILSVLNQDWPAMELIIVDGGSTDDSVTVIKKYKQHLAWWVSEKDSGQTNAINKGLARSTGVYVTWLGSDDILFPGAVRTLAEALDAHPQVGMAYGAVAFIDPDDRVTKTNSYQNINLERLLYHKHSTIAQPSSLLRRETLNLAGGLNESLHYCMDYDLWIRLHQHATSLNLGNEVFAGYRLHDDSKTVDDYTRMALEKIRVNRAYTGNIYNKVIASHYGYIVEGWLRQVTKGIKSRCLKK